jgi:hypothetical protein
MRLAGALGLAVGLMAFVSLSCSNKNTIGVLPAGEGLCEATCAKTCGSDSDCNTSQGELCCDYGQAGKACSPAAQCPIACTDDSKCDPTKGQACERVDLSLSEKYCTTPSNGLQLCSLDSDCTTAGDVCCGNYDQPFCLPASDCPKPCSKGTDCNTTNGEICCTSIPMIESHITAAGLCLNPTYTACPTTCTQSTDCNTAANEICCNGVCSTTCAKTCKSSSDCNQQICCKSALVNLPPPTGIFSTGPHCAGTPSYSTCSSCGAAYGCSGTAAGYCQGCTPQTASGGSCLGSRVYSCSNCPSCSSTYCPGCTAGTSTGNCLQESSSVTSCASCYSYWGSCSSTYCPGCTATTTTTGSCLGSRAYSCSTFSGTSSYMSYCVNAGGCTWNASTLACTGTITPCSAITTQTSCTQQLDCGGWSTGTTTCSGTLTPCSSLTTSTTCGSDVNCYWSSSTTTCTGTITPCSGITDQTTCNQQLDCSGWSGPATTCTGTPTACASLSPTTCSLQPGCALVN